MLYSKHVQTAFTALLTSDSRPCERSQGRVRRKDMPRMRLAYHESSCFIETWLLLGSISHKPYPGRGHEWVREIHVSIAKQGD